MDEKKYDWAKKFSKKSVSGNPDIRISQTKRLRESIFLEWIFFMKKLLFMKKNPENIFPDFFLQFLEDFLTKILKIYIFGIFGGVRT